MGDLSHWAGLDPREIDRLLIEMGATPPPVDPGPSQGLFQQSNPYTIDGIFTFRNGGQR